ncbi:flagellar basal-body MS-ring/collar protein FliF [uncultured Vagococcus sp.]|uniref:flagellar basal-body MS-ring/collar protein FliF n=1 Tax=uncultured Vagococcus sp. TaxID=189676 RepID=UPI0028D6E36A|nr:flagellar basal-body MS-ring/collar protein FliF [uncultured Vagococcus sp.]
MIDKLREFQERAVSGWKNLNTVKKSGLILVTLSVIIVILLTTYMAKKTNYVVLFSDLTEAESGVIVQDLDEKAIKYKLENNGTKVLIDEMHLDKFRIDLAVDNKLPNKSTGFEIFDEKNMMATDEDRKIMYQRAVTGELQRAIEALETVKKAKVMLVIPDKSIFENKMKEASASIVLGLNSGQAPSESTIQGIASLTSGAVENLPVKNIKIVDEQGTVLSAFLDQENGINATDLASKYQVLKQEFERNLEEKTTGLLETVFEPGKVKLMVNVDLDFDSIEKTTVTYADPKIRSENVQATGGTINQEQIQGGNVNDNVTNVVGNNADQNSKSFNRSVNNELDTETTKVLNAPGVVKKVSASVLINENLTPVESTQLEALVRSAIGFEQERGDSITIQGMKFAGEPVPAEMTTTDKISRSIFQSLKDNLIWLALVAGLLITSMVVFRLFRKRRRATEEEEDRVDVEQFMTDTANRTESLLQKEVVENEGIEQVVKEIENRQLRADEEADIEEQRLTKIVNEKEQQAKKYAKDNPDLAAELIKVWMKDK